MKKLLIVILSTVLVLTYAAASMAATVAITGELNFGKEFETNLDICDAKVTATATIAPDVKAVVTLKGDEKGTGTGIFKADEASVAFTENWGAFKVGYFSYKFRETDIITSTMKEFKKAQVSYAARLSDNFVLNLDAANENLATGPGLVYWVNLSYTYDDFGANINIIRPKATDDRYAYLGNFYYNINALRLYFTCGDDVTNSLRYKNMTIGENFDSPDFPLAVRTEYNFEKINNENEWGIRLDYKVTGNFKIEYQYSHMYNTSITPKSTINLQYLKANIKF